MGAPPLGSARSGRVSSRREGGGFSSARTAGPVGRVPGGVVSEMGMSPRDDDTPESPRDGGRDGRLFKYPEWDEVPPLSACDLSRVPFPFDLAPCVYMPLRCCCWSGAGGSGGSSGKYVEL